MDTLKKGSRGTNVIVLQKALAAAGFSTTTDGIFGAMTEVQVKAFQRSKGLVDDGIVGAKTWAALGVAAPAYIMGVDVSHYETGFDFVKGMKDGVVFMMTKASEGYGVDSTCASEIAKARAAGIKFTGCYHFFHASKSVQNQVNIYMAQYNPAKTEMPPILDLEETSVDGMGSMAVKASALAWLKEVEKRTNEVPILYVDMNMINLLGLVRDPDFQKYPMWVARYSSAEPTVAWTFWQFTDKGEQGADTDWFHGSIDDLKAFCDQKAS